MAHKMSLSQIYELLEKDFGAKRIAGLKLSIEDLIIKSLITCQNSLHQIQQCAPQDFCSSNFANMAEITQIQN